MNAQSHIMAPSIHIFVHYHKLNRMKGDTEEHLITHTHTRIYFHARVFQICIRQHTSTSTQAMRSRSTHLKWENVCKCVWPKIWFWCLNACKWGQQTSYRHTQTRITNRPTAIYLYRSSDLSAIIMYQMSILVRLIQMYFDLFALTVALSMRERSLLLPPPRPQSSLLSHNDNLYYKVLLYIQLAAIKQVYIVCVGRNSPEAHTILLSLYIKKTILSVVTKTHSLSVY